MANWDPPLLHRPCSYSGYSTIGYFYLEIVPWSKIFSNSLHNRKATSREFRVLRQSILIDIILAMQVRHARKDDQGFFQSFSEVGLLPYVSVLAFLFSRVFRS